HDHALDIGQRPLLIGQRRALAIEHDHVAAGQELRSACRAEIEHRPAQRIDGAAECLGQARPGQADLERGVLEMLRREARRAERPVLLLRMLQNEQREAALDRLDRIADAERQRLEAARAIAGAGGWYIGHAGAYRASGAAVQSQAPPIEAGAILME